MLKNLVALVLLGLVFASLHPIAGMVYAEDMDYSWGVVVKVFADQIIVTEYDNESEEDIDVLYTVDPEVELEGAKALKDIEVGDSLEIDYVIENGKRIAKAIVVEGEPEFSWDDEEY